MFTTKYTTKQPRLRRLQKPLLPPQLKKLNKGRQRKNNLAFASPYSGTINKDGPAFFWRHFVEAATAGLTACNSVKKYYRKILYLLKMLYTCTMNTTTIQCFIPQLIYQRG
jgi:hypothetical protein